MRPRHLLILASWFVFAAAILWPTISLIVNCIHQRAAPVGGFTFSARQFGLLWHSLWLSTAAAAICILVSLPAAFALGRTGRLSDQPLTVAALLATLHCPPMVFAFGWQRALPNAFDPHLRCLFVWSLWAWPIPAMILGAAWSRVGRRAFEAAILITSPANAFVRVVLPLLRPFAMLAAAILFILFFGDYGVPHACGLIVYATELLGWASDSRHTIDVLWPAVLPLAVTAAMLVAAHWHWQRCSNDDSDGESIRHSGSSTPARAAMVFLLLVTWGPPTLAMLARQAPGVGLANAMTIYGRDIAATFAVAAVAAIAALFAALGIATSRRFRGTAVALSVLFGAIPGALAGEALVAGYNHAALAPLYDHWPIVALAYTARFGWVAFLAAALISSDHQRHTVEQALTDGATHPQVVTHVLLPSQWPILIGVSAVVTILAVSDVATSTLVRVPSFNPIAHVIIEKFHRFEDAMMISLSFILVGAAILVGAVFAFLQGRRPPP